MCSQAKGPSSRSKRGQQNRRKDCFAAIDTFVRVAESRSFAEAARQMRAYHARSSPRASSSSRPSSARPCSCATRAASGLRARSGLPARLRELVGRTNEVVDQMREVTTSPTGRLRVHALPGFVLGHLARARVEFQGRWSQIVLDMIVNDAAIDPVKEGFDQCPADLSAAPSEELISVLLFPVRRRGPPPPGSPSVSGTPRGPRDQNGPPDRLALGYPTRERLQFHGLGAAVSLDLDPVLLTNSVHLLREYARGYRRHRLRADVLPHLDVVLSGDLIDVLPDHRPAPVLARSSIRRPCVPRSSRASSSRRSSRALWASRPGTMSDRTRPHTVHDHRIAQRRPRARRHSAQRLSRSGNLADCSVTPNNQLRSRHLPATRSAA